MPNSYYTQFQSQFEHFIDEALKEDIGTGDHSSLSCIDKEDKSSAVLLVKEAGIIAGIHLAKEIFNRYDPSLIFKPIKKDGESVKSGDHVFTVHGSTQAILATERIVLNTLQRMSGIASMTHELKKLIQHTSCQLLDTRKTTPNFRYAEKWAVIIGGGNNHRMGLFDALMIKDNHVDFCGSMTKALQKTELYLEQQNSPLEVVVECRNKDEIEQAIAFPFVSRILLDNHNLEEINRALKQIDSKKPTEASGNITKKNIVAIAETGVNFISMGALTYDSKSIDLSLKAI